jgi:hypothetical protein
MKRVLIFGVTGQIGSKICDTFLKKNFAVHGISSSTEIEIENKYKVHKFDVFNDDFRGLNFNHKFDALCFAQGINLNDSIYDFDQDKCLELLKINSLYIPTAISKIINANLLNKGSHICVISSVWQNIARQNKLSYCISKSSIVGIINSLSVDLAKDNHLINAILPGALNTKMTLQNLDRIQLENIKKSTFFDSLPNIDDVANLAYFLCSENNTSITGQFINVDMGFQNAKII